MQDMSCDAMSSEGVLPQHGDELSRAPEATTISSERAPEAEEMKKEELEDLCMEDAETLRSVEDIGEKFRSALPGIPFNELPIEVLQHIFSWCVAGFDPVGVVRERNSITSVCRLWRDAVRTIPEVWKLVPFSGPAPFDTAFACIERSKSLPLTIYIDQRDPNWTGNESSYIFGPDDMTDLLDRLCRYHDRVEELHIVVNTWIVMQSALSWLQRHSAPTLLKRLELRRDGPQYVILDGPPPEGLSVPGSILFGGGAPPMLRHINLSGVHVHWENTALMDLHSLSLRRLAVELAPSLSTFRTILQKSPCLRFLLLLDASPIMPEGFEDFEGLPPIKLDHLTDLSVGRLTLDHAIYVVSQFAALNLRRLVLSALDSEDYGPLLQKITGAFPALTVLFIEKFEAQDQATMYYFLQSLPNLRYLKIGGMPQEFFQALCSYIPLVRKDGTEISSEEQWCPICPQLEIVEVTDVEFDTLSWFYEYRLRMRVPLRHLFISYRLLPKLSADQIQWLTDLGPDVVRIVPYGSVPYNDSKYLS